MKKVLKITIIITAVLLVFPLISHAQCKAFAKKICKVELSPYTHDGNYHAAVLTEGEEAELYKTFYSDQDYRISICGSDKLPEFRVMDASKNVLYNNKINNYSGIWDFKLESSQQLKIMVKIPAGEASEEPASGCVAIMFGFKVK
jgi:hypothetical protein